MTKHAMIWTEVRLPNLVHILGLLGLWSFEVWFLEEVLKDPPNRLFLERISLV